MYKQGVSEYEIWHYLHLGEHGDHGVALVMSCVGFLSTFISKMRVSTPHRSFLDLSTKTIRILLLETAVRGGWLVLDAEHNSMKDVANNTTR